MTGLYVHIPFCRRRCLYCDFFTVGIVRADWDSYVSAVLAEAALSRFDSPEKFTLYIGGGTPSLIPPDQFKRLAAGLLSIFGTPEEFTIEVNPDDVTPELADVWVESGVDRVSMGVQSLVDAELHAIGRRHDSATALKAYEILSKRVKNISLDLIFGLPGQTLNSLQETLGQFITLNPNHISAYSLTFEERSALTRLRDLGKVEETDEDLSARMFEMISSSLTEAGYEQYEISNFAIPGYESKHNSLYWNGSPYIGLGPGAHSFNGIRTRTHNLPDINNYIKFFLTSPHPEDIRVRDFEFLTNHELREEMIMTRLRCKDGLDLRQYRERFGQLEYLKIRNKAQRFIDSGHLVMSQSKITLTLQGFFISDEIISSLF